MAVRWGGGAVVACLGLVLTLAAGEWRASVWFAAVLALAAVLCAVNTRSYLRQRRPDQVEGP